VIVRLHPNHDPSKLASYLLRSEAEPEILASSFDSTQDAIAQSLNRQQQSDVATRERTNHKHLIVAFAPGDGNVSLPDQSAIAAVMVRELGFDSNEFLAVAHNRQRGARDLREPREHDHFHVLIGRQNAAGTVVRDGWERNRLQAIARGIEEEFDLQRSGEKGIYLPGRQLETPSPTWERDLSHELTAIFHGLAEHLPPAPRSAPAVPEPEPEWASELFARVNDIADLAAKTPGGPAQVLGGPYAIARSDSGEVELSELKGRGLISGEEEKKKKEKRVCRR